MSGQKGGVAASNQQAWSWLWSELWRRSREPWGPTFTAYFVFGVVAFGGLGTFAELFMRIVDIQIDGIMTSLLTFFPALIGATSLQMILEESEVRSLRAFAITALLGFAILVMVIIAVASVSSGWGLALCMLASLASLWIWVIANANNPKLRDEFSADDPVGGAPTAPPAGDLSGFQT